MLQITNHRSFDYVLHEPMMALLSIDNDDEMISWLLFSLDLKNLRWPATYKRKVLQYLLKILKKKGNSSAETYHYETRRVFSLLEVYIFQFKNLELYEIWSHLLYFGSLYQICRKENETCKLCAEHILVSCQFNGISQMARLEQYELLAQLL